MTTLHHHLCKKSRIYHQWHQHPLHPHVHWGLLGAVALGVALSFVMLGWSETEVASVQVARAQIGTSFFPAFPGATFEERKQAYIANQGRAWEQWFPGAMVHAIWAWLERPQGNESRISEEIGYLTSNTDQDGMGWKNGWFTEDHQTPRQLRIYLQYYLEHQVISNADAQKLKEKLREVATTPGVWCAVANYHYRYLVTAYLYTTLIEDVGKVEFPQPSNDRYACPQPFTYNGRSYSGGNQYESREIYRDYLSYKIDQWLPSGDQEDFSDPYYYAQVHSMAALADFAPDEMLRSKGRMFFDFLVFNWAIGLSANHPAGANGRTYVDYEESGKASFPWVVFFDLYGEPDIEHRQNYADAYVFKYRFPQFLTDIVEAKHEGDDYYRIIRGYTPALGMTWWEEQAGLLPTGYRYDYVTPNYNLGGAGMGTGWDLNIKGSDVPFKLWINWCDEPWPPRGVCNTGSRGELFVLGAYGYQHRNALFISGGGRLHQELGSNSWDEQSSEGGWQFFRKGVVGVAARVSQNGPGALEVATIGVDYSTYQSFKNAVQTNTSLSRDGFRTSKGFTITKGYVDYGSDFTRLPFDRLEVWEGHAGGNDETKIVNWNNNVMTVSRGGSACEYNFNSWTTNGDCGGEPAGPPACSDGKDNDGDTRIDLNDPGCADANDWSEDDSPSCIPSTEVCDGRDNDCDTQIDEGNVCGGGTPACADGVDNDSDNLIDLSDPGCSSASDSDEYNAPFGSCPTTCMTMGGDTCSDSLQNATELPACSTAYCAPNYGVKRYCVKCNPGSTLNPATDRCEAGSTQNQPPRNLVLRYLGPTPTGGNLCGNGTINTGEQCDGANLGGATCPAGQTGSPTCTASCTLDTSSCSNPPAQVCTPNQTCASCYTSQNCAGRCNAQGTAWVDTDTNDNCPALLPTGSMQPFPHVAAFTWGGAVPWYNAKFDLMMVSNTDPGFANTLKGLNPNIILLPTRDINGGAGIAQEATFPNGAWTYTSTGIRCPLYSADTFLANYTNYAPTFSEFNGKRYNEYVGDWFANLVSRPPYDGYASDGLWPGAPPFGPENPCSSNIDINNNHINDYSEGINVDAAFRQGAEVVTSNLRRTVGNGYLLLNSGGWDNAAWQDKNGMVTEHASIGLPIDWWWWIKDTHDAFVAQGRQPTVLLLDANMNFPGTGGTPNPTRDDFQFMRYVFTLMSLNNGYVSVSHDPEGSHYWVDYYDEFDVDLGMPTSIAHEIRPHVFVRFFENGSVIHNSSGATVTVTDSQIRSLNGYTGPYWRFQGGQAPSVNNGQPFASVTLTVRQLDPYLGDGITLVNANAPRTVVSDIVIDNNTHSTSPGSSDAVLTGFSDVQDCGQTVRSEYTVRCAIHYQSYPAALATGGSNATARYTPAIGVAGNYQVFEWHGRLSSGTLASNARYVIDAVPVAAASNCTITGVSATCTVNQQVNSGQWNLLGTYRFTTTGGENVSIPASGTNGTVMADALMFRYIGP